MIPEMAQRDPELQKFLHDCGNFFHNSNTMVVFNIKKKNLCLKWWIKVYFVHFGVKSQSSIGVKCLNCWFFVGYSVEIFENSKVGLPKETNFFHVWMIHIGRIVYVFMLKRFLVAKQLYEPLMSVFLSFFFLSVSIFWKNCMFQGCTKTASGVDQGWLKGVLRVSQGCILETLLGRQLPRWQLPQNTTAHNSAILSWIQIR